jgi:hypothetical protein
MADIQRCVRLLIHRWFIVACLLALIGCSGSSSGDDSDAPLPADGAYEGSGNGGSMWFLIDGDGANLMNFAFYLPPDIEIDLVQELNTTLVPMQILGEDRVFNFSIVQPNAKGAVRGYVRDVNRFEVFYQITTLNPPKTYSGNFDCLLTFSKSSLGQSKPDYSFQDIAISLGAINILKDGYTVSFADFNSDGGKDLFMPCSPSLYRYTSGAVTGFGFYMVDRTYELFENKTPPDSSLFSFFADLNADGPLDLMSGGVIYKGQSSQVFTHDPGFQISGVNPSYCSAVDHDGDGDLDLFTGAWYSNTLDEAPGDPKFIKDYKVTYNPHGNSSGCAFAPLDQAANGLPEEDLDMALVLPGEMRFFRCTRGAGGTTFEELTLSYTFSAAPSCVLFGDLDNDLKPDLLVVSDKPGDTRLYKNLTTTVAGISFGDVTQKVFTDLGEPLPVGGDADFADYDNDGKLDLFVAAAPGMNDHKFYRNYTGEQGMPVGQIVFKEVSDALGLKTTQASRAFSRCTWCDVDGNGGPDLALGLSRLWLFQNHGGSNRYLDVVPRIPVGSQFPVAVGAIVLVDIEGGDQVFNKDKAMMRVVGAGRQTHLEAHFGVGQNLVVDVMVIFPDGSVREVWGVNVLDYLTSPLLVTP